MPFLRRWRGLFQRIRICTGVCLLAVWAALIFGAGAWLGVTTR